MKTTTKVAQKAIANFENWYSTVAARVGVPRSKVLAAESIDGGIVVSVLHFDSPDSGATSARTVEFSRADVYRWASQA